MSRTIPREYLGSWPQLEQNDGRALQPRQYAKADGGQNLYFVDPAEPTLEGNAFFRVPRIGFRSWDRGVQFLGMFVGGSARGEGLGSSMLNHFLDYCAEQEGVDCTSTGRIHKPGIAKLLSHAGFAPADDSFQVEILPSSAGRQSVVPEVQILRDEIDPELKVTRFQAGSFYDVVTPEEARARYPMSGPGSVVALHTRYFPVATPE